MITLTTPVDRVARISKKIIPALRRLGIKTVRDILFHLPSRYKDFSNQKATADTSVGETVTVRGIIKKIANRRTARKRMNITEAVIEDETGTLTALWFNQPFLVRNLTAGAMVSLSGKVALGPGGKYLQSPAYEKIQNPKSKIQNAECIHTGGLIAVYPETSGISSRWIRFLVRTFIGLRKHLADPLPADIRTAHNLPDIREALNAIHFPESREDANRAEERFIFEELFLVQLRALRERLRLKQHHSPKIPFDKELVKQFVSSLPFKLTDAQRRSMWEIFKDIEKPRPMNRLLEGDVGSGKTVVAAAAALLAKKAGYQTVFMAPTEILARQHYDTLKKLLAHFDLRAGLRIGAEKNVDTDTNVTIGTHALIQEGVTFSRLGLVVVDEQHRFGVEQRATLLKNHESRIMNHGNELKNIIHDSPPIIPHFLSMTATPIPRTLALTAYGDLDLSILDEMPPTRKPVITKLVVPARRQEAYNFIREKVTDGQQVFVICPRIEKSSTNNESGTNLRINESPEHAKPFGTFEWNSRHSSRDTWGEVKAVKEEYEKLAKDVFPNLKVGMLHGKLKSKEKDEVMKKFKNRELDILVSTSVVEVGVDVPNATIMMIEGAERFGLAQLHQFRGRVGRGTEQSYCFLFPTEDGMVTRRLKAVVESANGFELAEKDLKIRGPGDVFGVRQWGIPDIVLKGIANPQLVRTVRHEAVELLKKDPTLHNHSELQKTLEEREKVVHLE